MTQKETRLGREQLEAALHEQLDLLHMSCVAFDRGEPLQAKHIAVHLRVLWHSTTRSESLTSRLDLVGEVVDTAFVVPPTFRYQGKPEPVSTERRLIAAGGGTFAPIFDYGPSGVSRASFSQWWEGAVLSDGEGNSFTRKDLILTVANKDGGAHVDPKLDASYYSLTREGNFGIAFLVPTDVPNQFRKAETPSPVAVTLRQIGHETLKTLRDGYTYDGRNLYPGGSICYISALITPSTEGAEAPGSDGPEAGQAAD